MNIIKQKEFIIKQLKFLLNNLEKLYAHKALSSLFLFAPDYIIVADIIDKVETNNTIDESTLKHLNFIHRKTIAQQENINKTDKILEYDDWIEWIVKDTLINDGTKLAIVFHRSNALKESGDFYTTHESSNIVEQIRNKFSIKKK